MADPDFTSLDGEHLAGFFFCPTHENRLHLSVPTVANRTPVRLANGLVEHLLLNDRWMSQT
jgi:hypothetical protein